MINRLFVLSVLVSLNAPGISTGKDTPLTKTLFAAGHFRKAEKVYKAVLTKNPADQAAQIMLLRSLIAEDKWQEARKLAAEYMANAPQSADLKGIAGMIEIRAGHPLLAAKLADESLQIDPKNYWGLVAKARSLVWIGNLSASIEMARQAVTIDPSRVDAHFALVDAESQLIQVDPNSVQDCNAYLALHPMGEPNLEAAKSMPGMMPLIKIQVSTPPFQAVKPIPESMMVMADEGKVPTVSFSTSIHRDGDYVVVPTNLEGIPANLMLDTGGGSQLTVNKPVVDKLKVKPISHGYVFGVNGAETTGVYDIPDFTVGDEQFSSTPLLSSAPTPGDFDGILGASMFLNYVMTIDFKDNLLTLQRGKNAAAPPAEPGDKLIQIPFHLWENYPIISVSLAGKIHFKALIDSGADVQSLLSFHVANQLMALDKQNSSRSFAMDQKMGIGSSNLKQHFRLFTKPEQLGLMGENGSVYDFEASPLLGASTLDSQISPPAGFEIGALIGVGFLSAAKRVTFDYPHHLLTIELNAKNNFLQMGTQGV